MMKLLFERIKDFVKYGLNGVPLDFYLFIFVFIEEVFILMILSGVFNMFESFQHEILLVEKYTRIIVFIYTIVSSLLSLVFFRSIRFSRASIFALLFFAIACFSTVINQGGNLAYDYFTKLSILELFVTVVFMFNTAQKVSEIQFRRLLSVCGKFTIILILFLNIISLICLFVPHSRTISLFNASIPLPSVFYDASEYRNYSRYAGFYWHPNTLGTHCYLAVVLSIYFYSRKELRNSVFAAVLATCTFLIFVSHSRTGLIVLSFIVLCCILAYIEKIAGEKAKSLQIIAIVLAMMAAVVFAIGKNNIMHFIVSFSSDPYNTLNSVSSDRMSILVEVIRMVKSSPLLGCGWNATILQHGSAHNIFLTAVAWTGFVGLAMFILIFINTIRNGIINKSIKIDWWLWCIVSCVFIHCMFDQGIIGDSRHAYTYIFWLVLGYLSKETNCLKKYKEEKLKLDSD